MISSSGSSVSEHRVARHRRRSRSTRSSRESYIASESRSPPPLHTRTPERTAPRERHTKPSAKYATVVDAETDWETDEGSGNKNQQAKQRAHRSPRSTSRSRGKRPQTGSLKNDSHRSVVLLPRVPVVDEVLEELEELRRENKRLNEEQARYPTFSQPAMPASTYRTFHFIDKTSYYLDEPQWVPGDTGPRLHANIPIRNIQYYLDQHPDIAFAVFKTYRHRPPRDLSEIETKDGVFRAPEPETQNLSFISDTMIDAVEEFVLAVPDFHYYFPNFDARRNISEPYLFMFYSEPFMAEILPNLDGVSRRLLEQLRECIDASHGFDYSAAKSLAEKGFVSKNLFKYLIRPGDILVKPAGQRTKAYLAFEWAKDERRPDEGEPEDYNELGEYVRVRRKRAGHSDGTRTYRWKVPVWSWDFNGVFSRRYEELTLELKADNAAETVPINQLNIIPLRFAPSSLRETLEKRGKMFWQLRFRKFVSYHQNEDEELYNVANDQVPPRMPQLNI